MSSYYAVSAGGLYSTRPRDKRVPLSFDSLSNPKNWKPSVGAKLSFVTDSIA